MMDDLPYNTRTNHPVHRVPEPEVEAEGAAQEAPISSTSQPSATSTPLPDSTPLRAGNDPHMVSSRLAQAEQKKVMKQTLGLSVGAVVLVAVFVILILPAVIKLALQFSDSSFTFEEKDTISPQVPIISAPPKASTSQTLALTGFGEAKSKLSVSINGQPAAETAIGDDGAFSVELHLAEGSNVITATSTDEAGNQSASTTGYTVIYDQKAPEIALEEPTEGQSYVSKQNQTITVKGKTEPEAYVYINGRRTKADAEGAFSGTVRLSEGENTIALKAEDIAGNATELTVKVSFKE